MKTGVEKHVFLSYCRGDMSEVARLRDDLIEAGINVWWDQDIQIGKDWKQDIRKAMKGSYAFVMCLSGELTTQAESGVYPEILDAITEYRRRPPGSIYLIPVRLCDCEIPEIEIDGTRTLDRIQHVDLFQSANRARELKRLLAALEYARHPRPPHSSDKMAEESAALAGGLEPSVSSSYLDVSLGRLPSTSPDLFGREEELSTLDAAWNSPETNLVSLIAVGGAGKTALVNKWLLQMRRDEYRGAERVLGWSFYRMGASEGKQPSADRFMAWALGSLGDPNPAEGSPWDKGERLAVLLRKRRVLAILDGLEPLQYPPGKMQGQLRDPGLQCFLRQVAYHSLGLCVLATRLEVDDLKGFTRTSLKRVYLRDLPSDAGVAYLRHLGVSGTQRELAKAVGEFRGHALALTLLGTYLTVVWNGDIRERDKIDRLATDTREGEHARRVMRAYERWFEDSAELDILALTGLFDEPADAGAIQALRAEPAIAGLTERLKGISRENWQVALANLRAARLLAEADPLCPETLDCHPMVREHFRERVKVTNRPGWCEAHSRLFEYYRSAAVSLPRTLQEMSPLFAAVKHGCMAGRHAEAGREAWKRICRGKTFFSTAELGADGENLAVLSYFYEEPWTDVVAGASQTDKIGIMSLTASCLRGLGRLTEAAAVSKNAHETACASEDSHNTAVTARSLSETHLLLGHLYESKRYANQGIKVGRGFELLACHGALGDALHHEGQLEQAEEELMKAERLQKSLEPRRPFLYAFQGFRYWRLLLTQGKFRELSERLQKAFAIATSRKKDLDIAHCHLIAGLSQLLQVRTGQAGDLSLAQAKIEEAMDYLRSAARQDELPRGHLARASLYTELRHFEQAKEELDSVLEIARRSEMLFFEAEAYLEYARLHTAQRSHAKGHDYLLLTSNMINKLGYWRLKKELASVKRHLENK